MKLDKRIKDLSKIYNVFNRNSVTGNKQGYFANSLTAFSDLSNCVDGHLVAIDDDNEHPFVSGVADGGCIIKGSFLFFTSIDNVRSEKTYRPYTLEEFTEKFQIGRPIKFRRKGKKETERYLILNGYQNEHEQYNDQTVTFIHLGAYPYSLKELFDSYEWQSQYTSTEDFEPFGVEEE